MFTTLGTNVRDAMFAENFILVVATLNLISGLTFKLARTVFAAAIPFLLVFSGGLGF